MATGNTSYTAVLTRTLAAHGTEIFDAVTNSYSLLYLLKQAGNIKVSSGGNTLTHPIIFGTNSSFRSYGKYEAIDLPDDDVLTRAEYNVRIIAGSIVLSMLEQAQNAGNKEKLLDYAEEKKQEAEISLRKEMSRQFLQATPGSNEFNSLRTFIADTVGSNTVGGIAESGNTYWQNQIYSTAVTGFNTASAGLTALSTLLTNCTQDNMGPTAIVTTKAIWSLYDVGQAGNVRYVDTELADAGFRNLRYGTLPVLFDSDCPASHLYMIDFNSIFLQVLKSGNNQMTDFVQPANQLSQIALMYLFGNLTAGQRRTSGVATSITG